jgi:putative tryptophan/tyrosine transport system substrate-binding protein
MRRRKFIALLGSAAAWPVASQALQAAGDRIVWVHPSAPLADLRETTSDRAYGAFLEELRRLGHVEGSNLILERYSGQGRVDQYAELARTVVQRQPAVIFTSGTEMTRALVAATTTIPIVALLMDPVASGLITNLARPGGNITGASIDAGIEIGGKRLGLLKDILPTMSRVGFLSSRTYWEDKGRSGEASRLAAEKLGVSLIGCLLEHSTQETDYRRAFAKMQNDHLDALIVNEQAEHRPNRSLIVELALQARLPAMYPYREFVELGGLMAYTVDLAGAFRQAARQVDQILKGARPSEMPFYQQTDFGLFINLRTAKALNLNLSPGVLAIAEEVIE